MKIIFMGTPYFAVASLKKIIADNYNVVAVVTIPDKQQGRGQKLKSSPVKECALSYDIPVLQPDSLKDENFIKELKEFQADLYIVVAFRILPVSVFSIPEMGTLNVHASLLPGYRGAAPINRVIMNGDKITGITTMLIDRKVDTGQILLQSEVDIPDDMTAGELHDILAEKGADLLVETLKKITNKTIVPISQDDTLATKAPKIKKEDCKLNFSDNSEKIYNQIRGLSPYPASYCHFRGKVLKIFKCTLNHDSSKNPHNITGQIMEIHKNSFSVLCGDGLSINILEVQPEGKKRMPAKDFINGYRVKPGEVLE